MRIVAYKGRPVRRQRRTNDGRILVTFYDRSHIAVSPEDWERNSTNEYFDDPCLRRRDVVRGVVRPSIFAGIFG